MTESELSDAIVALARLHGWKVAAFRPAQTNEGWRTPNRYDANGYPDLTLAHPTHGIMFRELKVKRNKPTAAQLDWGRALGDRWAVWTEADWPDRVHHELQGAA